MEFEKEIETNNKFIDYFNMDHILPVNLTELSKKQQNEFLKYTRNLNLLEFMIGDLTSSLDAYGWQVGLDCFEGKFYAKFNSFGEYVTVGDTARQALVNLISDIIDEINNGKLEPI